MKDPKKVIRGKRSRAQGIAFELRARKDLEEKGWIVDKWTNNVEEVCYANKDGEMEITENCEFLDVLKTDGTFPIRKLVKAKAKWAGPGRPMMMGAGFPDFIAFRIKYDLFGVNGINPVDEERYWVQENRLQIREVVGVECKMNGVLDREEKQKCKWYLDNHIFSKILIAYKTKEKNKIVVSYKEFE